MSAVLTLGILCSVPLFCFNETVSFLWFLVKGWVLRDLGLGKTGLGFGIAGFRGLGRSRQGTVQEIWVGAVPLLGGSGGLSE